MNLRLSPIVDNWVFDGIPKESKTLLSNYLIAPSVALDQMHYESNNHAELKAAFAEKVFKHTLPTGLCIIWICVHTI